MARLLGPTFLAPAALAEIHADDLGVPLGDPRARVRWLEGNRFHSRQVTGGQWLAGAEFYEWLKAEIVRDGAVLRRVEVTHYNPGTPDYTVGLTNGHTRCLIALELGIGVPVRNVRKMSGLYR